MIKLIFLNVSRFRVDIGGGMHSIELGEWMISPKVDGFIAFDELKNLLWECESIVVEAGQWPISKTGASRSTTTGSKTPSVPPPSARRIGSSSAYLRDVRRANASAKDDH